MDVQTLATLVGMVVSIVGGVWFIEKRFEKRLDKVENRLKTELKDAESRQEQRLIRVQSELKTELKDAESRQEQRLIRVQSELKTELKDAESRQEQRLIRVQSELKTELKDAESRQEQRLIRVQSELKADIKENRDLFIKYIAAGANGTLKSNATSISAKPPTASTTARRSTRATATTPKGN